MKHSRGKKKSNHSIARILVLGLLVLTACLTICFLHVADVKQCFVKVKTLETHKDVESSGNIISDNLGKTLDVIDQASFLMNSNEDGLDEEEIFTLLKQYSQLEEFESVYYVCNDGKVLRSDMGIRYRTEEEIAALKQIKKPTVFVKLEEKDGGKCGYAYYAAPIYQGGKVIGQLIGQHALKETFEISSFDSIRQTGDIFLLDEAGMVYAQLGGHFCTEGENLFTNLKNRAADVYSENRITKFAKGLANKVEQETSFVGTDGMTYYIEIKEIASVDGLFTAYVFPETVYSDTITPIVFKSLLTCMGICVLTIAMLFYMWATSKRANDTIEGLAYGDPITGGKNENYFRNVAANVIWENNSIPFLVDRFDVSNFRYINDAYGHERADELLTLIIKESQKLFKGKEICVRMNSDQFVLLARNDKEFETKCEQLISIVNERAREIGIMFPIRLKQGIYGIRRDDVDISIIIDRANAARKSLSGDEKVLVATYSDKIVKQMYMEKQIEADMSDAMRNGEFKVYIQPKWDIVHDCIYGGEALVRWIRQDGTMIYPDQFIPVFERNGYIEKLDLYMLEEVCKNLRVLMDEGKTIFPISVNQSRTLLHNPDYINQVSKIMKRYRIPNGYIELEITETVFFDERNLMINTMNDLKKMDVSISMDDFGSGYSSLNMLKDVPFDVIKIDREFFSESITSNSSILILRKIVEMAEGLGIRVLCEGVETEDQVEILKSLGCCYVQGYYYSKPIDSSEFIHKYCSKMENGKEYYDALYAKQAAERAERNLREAESVKAQSATSAVEKFKKTYVEKQQEEKTKEVVDEQGRLLSAEEQKILAQEAKNEK